MASSSQECRSAQPPPEVIQKSIASSMAQIICNMKNSDYQERCRQMMQIENVADTEKKILKVLHKIDAKTARKAPVRKHGRQNARH